MSKSIEIGALPPDIGLNGFFDGKSGKYFFRDFLKRWIILSLSSRVNDRREGLTELRKKLLDTTHDIVVVSVSKDTSECLKSISLEFPEFIFLSDLRGVVITYYGRSHGGGYIIQPDGKLSCIPQRDDLIEDDPVYINYVVENKLFV